MKKILTVACLTLAPALAPAGDMERAMEYYERQNYPLARMHFISAAKAGDARAHEILGIMHALGPAVYPGVERDYLTAARYLDIAARNGRPVGRYMACAIARRTTDGSQRPPYCFDWIAETGKPGPR
jgi:TPR repeat protein